MTDQPDAPHPRKKVRVRPSEDGQWYVTVLGANNEVVFSGETIRRRQDAIDTAEEYAPQGALIEVYDSDGKLERDYPVGRR